MFYVAYNPIDERVFTLFRLSVSVKREGSFALIDRTLDRLRTPDVYDSGYYAWLNTLDRTLPALVNKSKFDWEMFLYGTFMVPYDLVTESLDYSNTISIASFFPTIEEKAYVLAEYHNKEI